MSSKNSKFFVMAASLAKQLFAPEFFNLNFDKLQGALLHYEAVKLTKALTHTKKAPCCFRQTIRQNCRSLWLNTLIVPVTISAIATVLKANYGKLCRIKTTTTGLRLLFQTVLPMRFWENGPTLLLVISYRATIFLTLAKICM